MKIIVKLKPVKSVHYGDKPSFGNCYRSNNWGSGWGDSYEPHFTGVVAQKVRRKTKQTKLKNGKTKSVVVRPAHWIIYKYTIPFDLLKSTGLVFTQKSRYFTLTPKK